MTNQNGSAQSSTAEASDRCSRALKATSRSHVRRIALNYAAAHRSHRFTRVSDEFLAAVESHALNFIAARIDRHPSRGVTLM